MSQCISEKVDGFVCIEVEYERSYETHLTPRVLEDDLGVIGQTSQAVGCPDHRDVVYVHLRHAHYFRSRETLQHTIKVYFYTTSHVSTECRLCRAVFPVGVEGGYFGYR